MIFVYLLQKSAALYEEWAQSGAFTHLNYFGSIGSDLLTAAPQDRKCKVWHLEGTMLRNPIAHYDCSSFQNALSRSAKDCAGWGGETNPGRGL